MLVLSCLPLHNRGPRDSSEPRLWTQSIGLCTGDSRWRRPTLRLALHSSYISRRLCCIRDVLCVLVIPWPRTCPAISHVPVFPLQIFLSNPDMRNSSSLYIFLRTCILFCRRISFQEEEKHSWHSEPVSRLKTRARVGLHTVFFLIPLPPGGGTYLFKFQSKSSQSDEVAIEKRWQTVVCVGARQFCYLI